MWLTEDSEIKKVKKFSGSDVGIQAGDTFGTSVSTYSDLDGDGINEIIVSFRRGELSGKKIFTFLKFRRWIRVNISYMVE